MNHMNEYWMSISFMMKSLKSHMHQRLFEATPVWRTDVLVKTIESSF